MEDFSGPWLGIGILIGFFLGMGAAFVVARKLKSKSVWEPERAYSRPSSATAHPLAISSKMAIPEVRRDTDIMGDTRKSGILQAQQSIHAGVNEVVLNMPDAASLRANTMGQNKDTNMITAAAVAGAAAASTHKRGVSTASVYDVDNLDDDWASLLASVDEMLVSLHHTAMTTNERPVAVRRLVAATSTRGMDGAVKAAVEEIIRFRSWNNTAAAHA